MYDSRVMETVLKKKTFMRPMVGATIAFTLATVPHMAWAVDDVAPADDAQAADIVELDLYNLTDIHGHIERVEKTNKETQAVSVREAGLAAVQCYLDGVNTQGKNFTFTLLGDNIGASPFTSGSQKDNPTIEALNELPVVGSTIGNHELDLGQEVFKSVLMALHQMNLLSSISPILEPTLRGWAPTPKMVSIPHT